MRDKAEPTRRDRDRFAHLQRFLESGAEVRFVDYARAERDCVLLAERLSRAVDCLDECHFAAIPRGGFIVLGMLSQLLALDRKQFGPGRRAKRVVLIDDCLLTGARFAAEVQRYPEARIWFGHLYSHPEARAAIERREDRVEVCVSANDLEDSSRDMFPDPVAREAWRARWIERLGRERYWFGQTGVIGFSWGEPTHLFWNQAGDEVESGWRFFAPDRCLKNRFSRRLAPRATRRSWGVPRDLIVGNFEDRLLLFDRRNGEGYALDGVGRSMWEAMAAWGDPDQAQRHLCDCYEIGESEVTVELASFLKQLQSQGLLEKIE